jgi:hypothetical protein
MDYTGDKDPRTSCASGQIETSNMKSSPGDHDRKKIILQLLKEKKARENEAAAEEEMKMAPPSPGTIFFQIMETIPEVPVPEVPVPEVPVPEAPARKKRKMVPEDQKNEAYKRRREKNTMYAKRSRDRARAKKEAVEFQLAALTAENDELKARLFELEAKLASFQNPQGTGFTNLI